MQTGERIRLIKESAELLSRQPISDIQLILGEHGIDTWDPDRWEELLDYSTDRIRQASDSTLLELAEFLKGEDAAPHVVSEGSGPWGALPVRVFLSHVHHDKSFVGDVKRRLAIHYGIDAFVAHDDIHPSKTWRDQIKMALSTCHLFAAFLHAEFHNSQWCDQEVGWALARRIPILPVRPLDFGRTSAHDGFLEEHQDVSITAEVKNPDHFVAHQIFRAVVREPKLRDVAVKSIAETFVASPSFAYTENLWRMLSTQPVIETEQLRRLEYAVQTNPKVYEAKVDGVAVTELVKRLVDKFEPPAVRDPWSDEPPF